MNLPRINFKNLFPWEKLKKEPKPPKLHLHPLSILRLLRHLFPPPQCLRKI